MDQREDLGTAGFFFNMQFQSALKLLVPPTPLIVEAFGISSTYSRGVCVCVCVCVHAHTCDREEMLWVMNGI
jgi:hypothetical protein